jgi:UDP-N-acetylmuramate--alanine ligase
MRDEVAALAPVHFIGIGGVGMSAIARILLARGIAVSGSDQRETPTLEALRALGADVFVGHEASNLSGAATVVFNSAIRGNNPELAAARSAGLAILHRAQLLAALARGSRTVAVSGTHGKTTTSAMIATICMRAGIDPTFLVGSDVN